MKKNLIEMKMLRYSFIIIGGVSSIIGGILANKIDKEEQKAELKILVDKAVHDELKKKK